MLYLFEIQSHLPDDFTPLAVKSSIRFTRHKKYVDTNYQIL